MAFTTQKCFMNVDPVDKRCIPKKQETNLSPGVKQYVSCADARAWSLDAIERNMYLADLIGCHQNPDECDKNKNKTESSAPHLKKRNDKNEQKHKRTETDKENEKFKEKRKEDEKHGEKEKERGVLMGAKKLNKTKNGKEGDVSMSSSMVNQEAKGVDALSYTEQVQSGYKDKKSKSKEIIDIIHPLNKPGKEISSSVRSEKQISINSNASRVNDSTLGPILSNGPTQGQPLANVTRVNNRLINPKLSELTKYFQEEGRCEQRSARDRELIKTKGEEILREMLNLVDNYQRRVEKYMEICKNRHMNTESRTQDTMQIHKRQNRIRIARMKKQPNLQSRKDEIQFNLSDLQDKKHFRQKQPLVSQQNTLPGPTLKFQIMNVANTLQEESREGPNTNSVSKGRNRPHEHGDLFFHQPKSLLNFNRAKQTMDAVSRQANLLSGLDTYTQELSGTVRNFSQVLKQLNELNSGVGRVLQMNGPIPDHVRPARDDGPSHRVAPRRMLVRNDPSEEDTPGSDFSIGKLERRRAGGVQEILIENCPTTVSEFQKEFGTGTPSVDNEVKILSTYPRYLQPAADNHNRNISKTDLQLTNNLCNIQSFVDETHVTGFTKRTSKVQDLNTWPENISLRSNELEVEMNAENTKRMEPTTTSQKIQEILGRRLGQLQTEISELSKKIHDKTILINSSIECNAILDEKHKSVLNVSKLCRRMQKLELKILKLNAVLSGRSKISCSLSRQFCSQQVVKRIRILKEILKDVRTTAKLKTRFVEAILTAKERILRHNENLSEDIEAVRKITNELEKKFKKIKQVVYDYTSIPNLLQNRVPSSCSSLKSNKRTAAITKPQPSTPLTEEASSFSVDPIISLLNCHGTNYSSSSKKPSMESQMLPSYEESEWNVPSLEKYQQNSPLSQGIEGIKFSSDASRNSTDISSAMNSQFQQSSSVIFIKTPPQKWQPWPKSSGSEFSCSEIRENELPDLSMLCKYTNSLQKELALSLSSEAGRIGSSTIKGEKCGHFLQIASQRSLETPTTVQSKDSTKSSQPEYRRVISLCNVLSIASLCCQKIAGSSYLNENILLTKPGLQKYISYRTKNKNKPKPTLNLKWNSFIKRRNISRISRGLNQHSSLQLIFSKSVAKTIKNRKTFHNGVKEEKNPGVIASSLQLPMAEKQKKNGKEKEEFASVSSVLKAAWKHTQTTNEYITDSSDERKLLKDLVYYANSVAQQLDKIGFEYGLTQKKNPHMMGVHTEEKEPGKKLEVQFRKVITEQTENATCPSVDYVKDGFVSPQKIRTESVFRKHSNSTTSKESSRKTLEDYERVSDVQQTGHLRLSSVSVSPKVRIDPLGKETIPSDQHLTKSTHSAGITKRSSAEHGMQRPRLELAVEKPEPCDRWTKKSCKLKMKVSRKKGSKRLFKVEPLYQTQINKLEQSCTIYCPEKDIDESTAKEGLATRNDKAQLLEQKTNILHGIFEAKKEAVAKEYKSNLQYRDELLKFQGDLVKCRAELTMLKEIYSKSPEPIEEEIYAQVQQVKSLQLEVKNLEKALSLGDRDLKKRQKSCLYLINPEEIIGDFTNKLQEHKTEKIHQKGWIPTEITRPEEGSAIPQTFNEKVAKYEAENENPINPVKSNEKMVLYQDSLADCLNKQKKVNTKLTRKLPLLKKHSNYYQQHVEEVNIPPPHQHQPFSNNSLKEKCNLKKVRDSSVRYYKELRISVKDILHQLKWLIKTSNQTDSSETGSISFSYRTEIQNNVKKIRKCLNRLNLHADNRVGISNWVKKNWVKKSRVEKICRKILQMGVESLNWPDLTYLHAVIHKIECTLRKSDIRKNKRARRCPGDSSAKVLANCNDSFPKRMKYLRTQILETIGFIEILRLKWKSC